MLTLTAALITGVIRSLPQAKPLKVLEIRAVMEQYRFPRSRKSRIRRKWAARHGNYRPARKAYLIGNTLICHPKFAAEARRRMEVKP